jgi:hypothetical protein
MMDRWSFISCIRYSTFVTVQVAVLTSLAIVLYKVPYLVLTKYGLACCVSARTEFDYDHEWAIVIDKMPFVQIEFQ